MESTELTVYQQDPTFALKRKDVATSLFESGLYPNLRNPAGAFAVVQYGAELGLGPMVSLQNINIINGKPAANGQVMLSLAMSRGVTFQVLSETDKECSIKFVKGSNQYISHFTLKDAEEAGLTGKDNWKKWRRDMLFWRCVAKGVRRIDPTSVMGLYTPDELTDGEVVDVSDYQTQPQQPEQPPIPDAPPPPEDWVEETFTPEVVEIDARAAVFSKLTRELDAISKDPEATKSTVDEWARKVKPEAEKHNLLDELRPIAGGIKRKLKAAA